MSAGRPTIYLFDVDGTLITTGGTGRRALERAMGALYGREDACRHFSFGGMTDRAIFRRGLEALGRPADDAAFERLLEAYLPILEEEVAKAEVYAVHPGIVRALEAVTATPASAVGLGTGNVEAGARIKLSRVDLVRWFDFGGYGSDHEDRAELIRTGAERGARRLGVPRRDCRLVVVGDTPKDVDAAHAAGGECLAVATGTSSPDELRDAGADHVFEDLAAPGALDALLGRAVGGRAARGLAAALLVAGTVLPARAEAPGPTVAELVGRLPACESLETCPAVKALVSRGPSIWPAVKVGLDAPDEMTRFWTLGVLSEVIVPASREALALRLDDPEIRVRAAAAFALGNHRDKAVTPSLVKALRDVDLNVRFAAAVGLGRVRDPASVPPLVEALRDEDDDVRGHAALALGDIGDRQATPRLLERLREDLKPHVRGKAAMALGSLRDPASLDPLLAHIGEEKDAKALAAAVWALGALGDAKAIPALEKLAGHADPEVREYVAEALAAIRKAGRPPTP